VANRLPIIRDPSTNFASELPATDTIAKASVGLGNVDNTSDADKPVSTAQAAALDGKALADSPWITGNINLSGSGDLSLQINPLGARAIRFVANNTPNTGMYDVTNGTWLLKIDSGNAANFGGRAIPSNNNVYSLGSSSLRWSVVYAATGSINTSDAREKTAVSLLTDAEIAAAADLAREIGTYQWLSSIAEKGTENARHHAGLTVQRAIEIMQSHGLDSFRYGFICYDQWTETPEIINSWPAQDAVLDEDGNVVTPAVEAGSEITQAYRPAGDRYSFRTDELLLFMARGFAARLDALEAK
jgi:hypothetical protein